MAGHSSQALRFPLHLVANQPYARLLSQLDMGAASRASKIGGREPVRLHPEDADGSLCGHGNSNVLTQDRGTSRLAQGSTGQHSLVEVERYRGAPPEVRAYEPPEFLPTDSTTLPEGTEDARIC